VRPLVDLRLGGGFVGPELLGDALLLGFEVLQPDELGDVLDPMDDEPERTRGVEDRQVHRAPETLFEAAAFGIRSADVIALDRHRVRYARGQDAIERRPQVRDPGRVGLFRIVGEDVEDRPADDRLPPGHRRAQIRIGHGDDPQLGIQDEEESRARLEERSKVELWDVRQRHGAASRPAWKVAIRSV
jgi:hypothetical protein